MQEAKEDRKALTGNRLREKVLTLGHSHHRPNTPGEGIFYRDLGLMRMRTKLARLERDAKAMLSDKLLANKEYLAASASKNRAQRQLRRRPPVSPGAPQQGDFDRAYRELPEFAHQRQIEQRRNQISRGLQQDFVPYANEKLGPFILEVEKAKNAVQRQYHENAKLHNSEEFRLVDKIDYKRIHFRNSAENMASQMASDIEPPDDMGQLKAAMELQKRWQTSTDDWDTVHKYEKQYEQLNPVLQRWLRRVKPYRFAQPADSNASQGNSHE